jgi:hypothetical protein
MARNEYPGSPVAMADQSGMLNPYALAPATARTWLRDHSAHACDQLLPGRVYKLESA